MGKYTALEQAIQDPSLVIVTDNITAQTESAEESTELSNWNKLWTISECRSTLSEMGTLKMNIIRNH